MTEAMWNVPEKSNAANYVRVRGWILGIYILCLFLATLYSRTQSSLIGYVNSFIIICVLLTASKQETFLLLLGLQFINTIIPITIGGSKIGFLAFAYILVFLKYYTVGGGKITSDFLIVMLIVILEVINVNSNADKPYISIMNWILSMWYMVEFSKEDISLDIHDIALFFCLAVWTLCTVNILEEYFALGTTLDPKLYGGWLSYADSAKLNSFSGREIHMRFGSAYKSVEGTNGLTFDLSLGICLSLFGLTAKNKKYRLFYIATVIAFMYFGFITISRGFYIEMIILFGLFFVSRSNTANKLIVNISLFLIIGLVATVFIFDNLSILFDEAGTRFSEGNGLRGKLIEYSFKLLFSDDSILMFGVGSHYPDIYRFTAHNMVVDSFLSLGVIGCVFYYTLIIKGYKSVKRYFVKFNLFNYIPLIMLVSYRMISGCVRNISFYYFLLLCYYLTQYNEKGDGDHICITSH